MSVCPPNRPMVLFFEKESEVVIEELRKKV